MSVFSHEDYAVINFSKSRLPAFISTRLLPDSLSQNQFQCRRVFSSKEQEIGCFVRLAS
jgi:hypothetical protein